MSALRILLADDHPVVRLGLRALLAELPDVEVVGEAGDGHEALRLIDETKPDIALIDISMPGLNGLEVVTRATKDHARTRTVIVSMHRDDEFVRRALVAGASGYLLKSAGRGELEMALRAVARGDTWLSPEVSKRVVAAYAEGAKTGPDAASQVLTPRQREVLQLIAEGLSTREIATRLGLSAKTVETHRTELMERLDIHGVAGLVRYAIRAGIIHPY
jgi:DNA-binding NarL/FixJ family response regulator